jgi:signal transduction histidine kinase
MLNLWECEQLVAALGVAGTITFTGHLRDISERKRVEAELKASRARLAEAADTARRRIQGDLQDPAQQVLLSATMNLRSARARAEQDPREAAALLDEPAVDHDQSRELARGIHSPVVTLGDINPTLQGVARRFSGRSRST